MPLPFSEDLRWRIVWLYCYKEYSINDVANILVTSSKTVRRIVKLYEETDDVIPKHYVHGPSRKLDAFEEMIILQFLLENPAACLTELKEELLTKTNMLVSCSTICRTLQRLGFTRKKLQYVVLSRSDEDRATFSEEMQYITADKIIWVDESGCDRRNSRHRFGYHVRGITPVHYNLGLRGQRLSVTAAMSTRGIEDINITDGTVNGEDFSQFIECSILPIMNPFDGTNPRSVLILDNASVHHVNRVVELINSVGAIIRFLPAYSPDYMPLEEVFSKAKYFLKAHEAVYDSTDNPSLLLTMAFMNVTTADCLGYIKHAGYYT